MLLFSIKLNVNEVSRHKAWLELQMSFLLFHFDTVTLWLSNIFLVCWESTWSFFEIGLCTAWKVSVFGVIRVRIFPHSDWILRISPYSFRMRENTYQNNSEYGHFLHSDGFLNDLIDCDFFLFLGSYIYICIERKGREIWYLYGSIYSENYWIYFYYLILFVWNLILNTIYFDQRWQQFLLLLIKCNFPYFVVRRIIKAANIFCWQTIV